MGALSKEQIKKDSEKAVKGMHPPAGFNYEAWESAKLACRRAVDEYVLNPVRHKKDIEQANREAEKIIKRAAKGK